MLNGQRKPLIDPQLRIIDAVVYRYFYERTQAKPAASKVDEKEARQYAEWLFRPLHPCVVSPRWRRKRDFETSPYNRQGNPFIAEITRQISPGSDESEIVRMTRNQFRGEFPAAVYSKFLELRPGDDILWDKPSPNEIRAKKPEITPEIIMKIEEIVKMTWAHKFESFEEALSETWVYILESGLLGRGEKDGYVYTAIRNFARGAAKKTAQQKSRYIPTDPENINNQAAR